MALVLEGYWRELFGDISKINVRIIDDNAHAIRRHDLLRDRIKSSSMRELQRSVDFSDLTSPRSDLPSRWADGFPQSTLMKQKSDSALGKPKRRNSSEESSLTNMGADVATALPDAESGSVSFLHDSDTSINYRHRPQRSASDSVCPAVKSRFYTLPDKLTGMKFLYQFPSSSSPVASSNGPSERDNGHRPSTLPEIVQCALDHAAIPPPLPVRRRSEEPMDGSMNDSIDTF